MKMRYAGFEVVVVDEAGKMINIKKMDGSEFSEGMFVKQVFKSDVMEVPDETFPDVTKKEDE